ncbi:MAG: alpha/beta hydrolase family protein, partial [Pirellula sp.]
MQTRNASWLLMTIAVAWIAWTFGAATKRAAAQSEASAQSSKELWYGELDAGVRVFRFAVTLEHADATAEWTGELLSLDEGGSRFRLQAVRREPDKIAFEIKSTAAVFEATVDGTRSPGVWKQRGATFPLELTQVESIPEPKLKAIWKGQLDAGIQKIEVAFRECEDGRIFFDSLSQKAGGFVAKKQTDQDTVVLEVPGVQGTFRGKLSEDGSELQGQWKQGLLPLKLQLKRSQLKELQITGPIRPQTPKPPFPYQQQPVSVENPKAVGVRLAGTLTLPNGSERVPAVVLISGSGPQDRDEAILEHRPFAVLADHLTRRGVAVLRFDDRGVAESTGDFASATSQDFASDVRACIEFLRNHPRIDSERVGLCGHSEGGLIAPMAAVEDSRIAFCVLLAGTGVPGDQILASQTHLLLKASGVGDKELESQAKLQRAVLDLGLRRPALSAEEISEAVRGLIQEMGDPDQPASKEVQEGISQQAKLLAAPWFQFFLAYDPAPTLEKLRCPVLILNGSKDLQVDPTLNVPAIEAALRRGGNNRFRALVLPDLNHLFQTCETGSP